MRIPEVSDRVLWLTVPLALVATTYLLSQWSEQLKEAASAPVPEEQPTAKKVDDDAEEHIPAEALRVLSDGYSFELRKAAFKIAQSQSLRDGPRSALLRDISSKDAAKRDRGVQALSFLIDGPFKNDSDFQSTRKKQQQQFQNLAAYRASVTALVHLLPLHTQSPTPLSFGQNGHPSSPVAPFFRTATETALLSIILELLRASRRSPIPPEGGVPTLLKAGIVKRWLANYPFPCTLPLYSKLNFKRSDVAELLTDKAYALDDLLMAELFRNLLQTHSGQAELCTAGLASRSSRLRERFRADSPDEDLSPEWYTAASAMAIAVADPASAGWQSILPSMPSRIERNGIDIPRHRSSDRSEEEERVRRRHREAIVVADPGRPVSSQDILQRINSGGPPRRGGLANEDAFHSRPQTSQQHDGVADSDRDEIASHLSFSEIDDTTAVSTPSSMPSLLSINDDRTQTASHERARRRELEDRLGARQISGVEAGLTSTTGSPPTRTVEQMMEQMLEEALRNRERLVAETERLRQQQQQQQAGDQS